MEIFRGVSTEPKLGVEFILGPNWVTLREPGIWARIFTVSILDRWRITHLGIEVVSYGVWDVDE